MAEPKGITESNTDGHADAVAARHLRFGWWSLFVFLTLGFGLEALHGLKVGWYLNVSSESRRLMWTLAHAHGTLLALVNLAFAFSLRLGLLAGGDWRRRASSFLLAGSVLLPAGFFLGGLFVYGGDPGLGVLLVPIGALLLLAAVYLSARASGASGRASS